jgi:hypothetical protein
MRLALLAFLGLAACGPPEPSVRDLPPRRDEPTIYSEQVQRLEGTWETGWELNRFREDGREYAYDHGWCLVGEGKLNSPLADVLADVPGRNTEIKMRVIVEGRVSESNDGYGHMGLCEREVQVIRVISSELISRTPLAEPATP